ncbi:MAG TPA: PH domain-containing protein [Longimicrobiaceae bacterium]|nr:PH domain-containing protein [Longimicrobiaceae bacterium]
MSTPQQPVAPAPERRAAAPPSPRAVEARLLGGELRPDPNLFRYYAITSLAAGPFFWAPLIPLYFRYHTMRYRFDEEGVSMRWGILFRREVSLTYARIQDIHLSSNFVERWLGLAKIQVQTASGSSGAEMTIEGFRDFEAVRDFLYSRMRGAKEGGQAAAPSPDALPAGEAAPTGGAGELAAALREVARELRATREALATALPRPGGEG